MNSSFPDRWSFSYLNITKLCHIIGEPKYKYGQQEQVTVRNHNRSTALERLSNVENDFYYFEMFLNQRVIEPLSLTRSLDAPKISLQDDVFQCVIDVSLYLNRVELSLKWQAF